MAHELGRKRYLQMPTPPGSSVAPTASTSRSSVPAVNEVTRINGMCRALDQDVVLSSACAEAAGPARSQFVGLGRYSLRGVARPQEPFTLDRGGEGAAPPKWEVRKKLLTHRISVIFGRAASSFMCVTTESGVPISAAQRPGPQPHFS